MQSARGWLAGLLVLILVSAGSSRLAIGDQPDLLADLRVAEGQLAGLEMAAGVLISPVWIPGQRLAGEAGYEGLVAAMATAETPGEAGLLAWRAQLRVERLLAVHRQDRRIDSCKRNVYLRLWSFHEQLRLVQWLAFEIDRATTTLDDVVPEWRGAGYQRLRLAALIRLQAILLQGQPDDANWWEQVPGSAGFFETHAMVVEPPDRVFAVTGYMRVVQRLAWAHEYDRRIGPAKRRNLVTLLLANESLRLLAWADAEIARLYDLSYLLSLAADRSRPGLYGADFGNCRGLWRAGQ